MARTLEAIIEEGGKVRLLEQIDISSARRALVTVLDEEPRSAADDCTRLSEPALAEDWNRAEHGPIWSRRKLW